MDGCSSLDYMFDHELTYIISNIPNVPSTSNISHGVKMFVHLYMKSRSFPIFITDTKYVICFMCIISS